MRPVGLACSPAITGGAGRRGDASGSGVLSFSGGLVTWELYECKEPGLVQVVLPLARTGGAGRLVEHAIHAHCLHVMRLANFSL